MYIYLFTQVTHTPQISDLILTKIQHNKIIAIHNAYPKA